MTVSSVLTARAPGVYREPSARTGALAGVRMDVCGFVGVAPRGPAREPASDTPWPWTDAGPDAPAARRTVPVAVESWDAYVDLFGGFEGPGLLPYAVHTFFRQGGRRAWVARVVHAYGDARDGEGAATGAVPGLAARGLEGLPIRARNAGDAGNGLRADLAWTTTALELVDARGAVLRLRPAGSVVAGALLRLTLDGGGRTLAFVEATREEDDPGGAVDRVVLREEPTAAPTAAERVEATLTVDDGAGTVETHDRLGLHPDHPRWLAGVLDDEASLLEADPRWRLDPLLPGDPALPDPPPGTPLAGGFGEAPAVGRVPGLAPERDGLWLVARNEGRWGDALQAGVAFEAAAVTVTPVGPATLEAGRGAPLPVGSLLRITDDAGERTLRFVVDARRAWTGPGERRTLLDLDGPLPATPASVEVVTAELRVMEAPGGDGSKATPREERHAALGLAPRHPRWMADVLLRESRLVRPHEEWTGLSVLPADPELAATASGPGSFRDGADRWDDVVPEDFFDAAWTPAEPTSGEGVHALARLDDLALLAVPDLYAPGALPRPPEAPPRSWGAPHFAECVAPPEPAAPVVAIPPLAGLLLDPRDPTDLETVTGLQLRLAELAATLRSWVVLLDVPTGLDDRAILRWRDRFDTAFAAAYHPWIAVAVPDDPRGVPVRIPPSAAAAGIVAATEVRAGVPEGPANQMVDGAVAVADRVTPERHDRLHPRGVNVLLQEREGVRLTGARTLSRERAWRQLSVRRLITLVARTLEREMRWVVFEPNDAGLRNRLRVLLLAFLRRLHAEGAFRGAREEDAFFVRCDESLNPPAVVDQGRLVAEVGMAPAEPTEFILLRLERGGDGSLRVEG